VNNTTVVLFIVFGVNRKPNILKFPSIKTLNHLNTNLGGIYKVYDVLYTMGTGGLSGLSSKLQVLTRSIKGTRCKVCSYTFMVFNNISIISWRSALLVEETGVPEKTTDLFI
jgi:hypothetical protein